MNADERRREILTAATNIFAQSNYRAARVAAIAEAAGVSEALLYKHFPSKKALFCEILQRVGLRIVEIWEKTVADETDALEALRRAGEVYVDNLRNHHAEAALQFQALAETADPDIAAVLRMNHLRYITFFEKLVKRGQHQGVIRADVDPHVAANILNGTGLTFTLVQRLDLDGPDASPAPMIAAELDWLSQPAQPSETKEEASS
ncbi:MAG: TetR/AcrR family transcriptional regulator [Actinomycetia bacterium]|nr:TetR/AcrR family transcriptional regulator [Actinomycetes bacterium]MCP4963375.1 TetR/AcrR family transcriptional regulator [Actinomycetes bacterium]